MREVFYRSCGPSKDFASSDESLRMCSVSIQGPVVQNLTKLLANVMLKRLS